MGPLRPHRASEGSAEIPSSSVLNAHPLLILPPSKHELIELVLDILLEMGASPIFVQRERTQLWTDAQQYADWCLGIDSWAENWQERLAIRRSHHEFLTSGPPDPEEVP